MAKPKGDRAGAVSGRATGGGKPAQGVKQLGKKQMKKTLGGRGRAYNFHEDAG